MFAIIRIATSVLVAYSFQRACFALPPEPAAVKKGTDMRSADSLSLRQERILAYIREFVQDHGYPPAIRDIQAKLQISSTSVVAYNLKALETKGMIQREGNVSRGIKLPV